MSAADSPPDPPPIPEDFPATADALSRLLQNRPILWVGAGTSIAAGYPSTNRLVEEMRERSVQPIEPGRTSFFEVADRFVEINGGGTLADLLHDKIGPPRDPLPLHRALARLAGAGCFAAIITTNYDSLLERALDETEVPFLRQALEANSKLGDRGQLRLLKLHGSLEDWLKVILTEESYRNFEERHAFLRSQLEVYLHQNPVLFVGCSLQDPRILGWLDRLTPEEVRGLRRWWALMTPKEWEDARASPWNGAPASAVLDRSPLRPLILKDHPHLGQILAEVAGKLVRPVASRRLDLKIQVQPGGPWTAHLEDLPVWPPADVFQDQGWSESLDRLRELGVVPLPTDEKGKLTEKAAAAATGLRKLAEVTGRRLTEGLLSLEARELLAAAVRASPIGRPPFLVIKVEPATHDAEAEQLADRVLALPWELLWIEDRFPVETGALDLAREAVVPGMDGIPLADRTLSVVATVAAPTDAHELNYEEEMYRLWHAVATGDEDQEKRLQVTDLGTLEEFATAIEKQNPPVAHFSGHGSPGLLCFENELALSHKVPVKDLVRRFRDSESLPRLFYLSACHGATAGSVSSREGVGLRMVDRASTSATAPSTAATLHRAGFPQVVAYFGPVGDQQATRAAAVFYSHLAAGETARQALRRARRVSADALGDGPKLTHVYPLGWAQLALYHRGPDHPTALPSPAAGGADPLRPQRRRELVPFSKTGSVETVEGIQGVQRLRFGFVGRRGPRAEAIARWERGNRCLVVSGLGGLGKTALCAELAPLLAGRLRTGGARILAFDGRHAGAQANPIFALWQEVQAARSDRPWLETLAGLQEKGVTVEALMGAIARLAQLEGGLLIYLDDAESLQVPVGESEIGRWVSPELRRLWESLVRLARPGGPVGLLASSRYAPEGMPEEHEALLPLPPMSPYEIIRLFAWEPTLGRLPAKDRAWLAERVDGHPRTVEYLEALARRQERKVSPPGKSYAGTSWREEILQPILETVQERISADLLLGRIWETLDADAREHLGRCSVLDSPVPWDAIQAVAPGGETTEELIAAGMLSPFQGPWGSNLWWAPHRLVSDEVRQRWTGDPKAAHRQLGEWFQERLEAGETFDFELARRAVDHFLKAGEADRTWPAAELIVIRLRGAGRYREGLIWIEKVLDAGPTGACRGKALAFQVQLAGSAGVSRESSKSLLQEALTLVDREDQAFVLNELGRLCQRLGQLGQAARYLMQAVELASEVQGPSNIDVANLLHSLAGVLKAQGDLSGARSRLERSLEIKATVFGTEDHPSVATSLHSLAGVLKAQGDLSGARSRLERSLEIKATVFGTEDHPDVAASLHELAGVLQAQGDLSGAREKLERVLAVDAKIYGTRDHYSTAMTEEALAPLLWEQGEQQRAAELLAHAYGVYLQQLGPDHPHTLRLAPLFERAQPEPETET